MDEKENWIQICKMVRDKSLNIFPDIKSKKLKSEIISNLFETQSEKHFNSIGITVIGSKSDRDPDLYVVQENKPYEIKVTGVDNCIIDKCKWMGGKYSKRTSDYILIMWNLHNTFWGETISFNITKCFINESEWNAVDNGNENYYATVFQSLNLLQKDYKCIVGSIKNGQFFLESFN